MDWDAYEERYGETRTDVLRDHDDNYPDEPEPDFDDTDPPHGAVALGSLTGGLCGLCGRPMRARQLVWQEPDAPATRAHPSCWATELAEQADPYRLYGLSRRAF